MSQILNIGVSALHTYQQALNTTGHNVANVNTPGYSRQSVNIVNRDPQFLNGSYTGTGSQAVSIERAYDEFLAGQVRASQASASDLEAFYKYAAQIDQVIADTGVGLDAGVQDFFDALQGLTDDPSSTPVRELLLSESESMVDRFQFLDRTFDDARDRVQSDINNVVDHINNMSQAIADLNIKISGSSGVAQGKIPNDLLDQRDQAINELSQYVNLTVLPLDNASTTVYFGKGQPLVLHGDANKLQVVQSPEFPDQLDIQYVDRGLASSVAEQITGGELAGLLRVRDEIIDDGQRNLGLVAMGIASDVNDQHKLGFGLDGSSGLSFFTDFFTMDAAAHSGNGAGSSVTARVEDVGQLQPSDYRIERNDALANPYVITRLSDDTQWSFTGFSPLNPPPAGNLIDGMSFSGLLNDGDIFILRPSMNATSALGLAIKDPAQVAAASEFILSDPTWAVKTGTGSVGSPAIKNVSGAVSATELDFTYNLALSRYDITVVSGSAPASLALAYNPATDSGDILSLNFANFDLRFTSSGTLADGDQFRITLADNGPTFGVSDNRNASLLADLQIGNNMLGGTATYQDSFGNYVASAGSRTHQASINKDAQNRMLEFNTNSLESVKGVNLDEEAANLIRFQQAYQAAAQVVATAGTVFDTLIAAVR